MSRPVTRPSFMLAMAERVEVVIDFRQFPYPEFTELYIENRLVQEDGRGPEGKLSRPELTSRGTRLLQFRLGEVVHDDPSQVPAVLRPFDPIPADKIAAARTRTRTFEFERHVHLEFMRVLTRDGRAPYGGVGRDYGQHLEADGLARKDTITLGPNSVVEVYVRFSNYPGPWVFHCHNLSHEDHAMMARYDVLPAPPS